MTNIKALVDRLRFIANHTHEVMAEEIEEVCDAAADALAPLAGPVGMPEEPKEFVQVRASKAQTYFQEVAIAYIDALLAHAEQLQQKNERLNRLANELTLLSERRAEEILNYQDDAIKLRQQLDAALAAVRDADRIIPHATTTELIAWKKKHATIIAAARGRDEQAPID